MRTDETLTRRGDLSKSRSTRRRDRRYAMRLDLIGLVSLIAGFMPVASGAAELPPLTGKDVVFHRPANTQLLDHYYPAGAKARHLAGAAEISCMISDVQSLTDCKVISETPPGEGFGSAAVGLFSTIAVDPTAKDGSSTAGRSIDLHFTFRPGP
jgi:protein TonB